MKDILQDSGPTARQNRADQRGGGDASEGKQARQLETPNKKNLLTEHIFEHLIQ